MTTKNSVLLIVKQNNGIDYNSLLSKFSGSYSNINSARAALSRTLKDLSSFGYISRQGNRFFIMAKGDSEIYSEVKNKLVIGLNSALKQKHPEDDADLIVSRLQVLLERSRQDRDLLKTSKSSIDFSVADIEDVQKKLEEKSRHLGYISKVLTDQVNSLKELDFQDTFARPISKDSIKLLSSMFPKQENEFTVECQTKKSFEALSGLGYKAKDNSFLANKESLGEVAHKIMESDSEFQMGVVTVFSSTLKVQFYSGKIFLSGPYSEIARWRKTN